MAAVEDYRNIVQRMLTAYAQQVSESTPQSQPEIETEVVFDQERDHYQLVNVGWQHGRRVYGCVLHIDIRQGKVWIQHNGTETRVAEELVQFGIPPDQIVLGFQSPAQRQLSDFAVN